MHLSNNYKARDVMMEIHWGKSNQFTHYLEPDMFTLGYSASKDGEVTSQDALSFGEEFQFDKLAAHKCTLSWSSFFRHSDRGSSFKLSELQAPDASRSYWVTGIPAWSAA